MNIHTTIQRDIVPKDLVGQLGKAEKVLASGAYIVQHFFLRLYVYTYMHA